MPGRYRRGRLPQSEESSRALGLRAFVQYDLREPNVVGVASGAPWELSGILFEPIDEGSDSGWGWVRRVSLLSPQRYNPWGEGERSLTSFVKP